MMRNLPQLGALRAFEAAARHLSFRRAAEELAVTPTAVSHQVRLLEEVIGRKLFDRLPRGVALTAAGQSLYPALRDGLDDIARAVTAVRASRATRTVTVTATMAFTSGWLLPRASDLRARHPAIDLRLLASDDVVDLAGGAADIAIRYGVGDHRGSEADLLLEAHFAPVCSPGLGVQRPEDLEKAPLIHFEWRRMRDGAPTWHSWFLEAGLATRQRDGDLVFSEETHAIQAAVAGQGVALAALPLVARELDSGLLVRPFGPVLRGENYYLLVTRDRRGEERIEAVRKWLLESARSQDRTQLRMD